MSEKLYDVSVKTGTYMKDGEEKGRYVRVGVLMKADSGHPFLLLEKWFNPAGINQTDGRDSILLSLFRDKPKDTGPDPAARQQGDSSNAEAFGNAVGNANRPKDGMTDEQIPW